MENQEEKKTHGSLIISLLALLILLVAVIGISFATITFTNDKSGSNTLNTGKLTMTYTENTNGISIVNAVPISDDIGKKLNGKDEYFDFTVGTIIKGTATVLYEISAEKDINSTLKNDEVKLYLEKKVGATYESVIDPQVFTPLEKKTDWNTPKGNMLLTTGKSSKTENIQYRLRMWVKKDTVLTDKSKTFIVRVQVKGGISA